nr:hypothetical protein [Nitrosomonas nitrosa]
MIRAARGFADDHPDFALASGLAALRWISLGYGHEITGLDVLGAYNAVMRAASVAGVDAQQVKQQIRDMISGLQPSKQFVKKILAHHLSN